MSEIEKCKQIIDLIGHNEIDFIYDADLLDKNISPEDQQEIINAFKYCYFENKNEELKNNSKLIMEYFLFLQKTLELIDFLHIANNELEKAIILEYLIHKGYLSYQNHFVKNEKEKGFLYYKGINIIGGSGVCRHFADFYNDLFDYSYHKTYSGHLHREYYPYQEFIHAPTNHIINLVSYHDSLYGIDLTNKTLFKFINKYQLQDIQNPNIFMTYRTYYDLFSTSLTIEDIKSNLNKYAFFTKNNELSVKDYQKLKCHLYDELKKKKKVLESFSLDTNSLKKNIKEKMLSKK